MEDLLGHPHVKGKWGYAYLRNLIIFANGPAWWGLEGNGIKELSQIEIHRRNLGPLDSLLHHVCVSNNDHIRFLLNYGQPLLWTDY